jgi:hypothetical protein
MNESVTLLGPAAPSTGGSRVSDLPRDLLEQVRGRVRLLALLLLAAFAVGPVLFGVSWVVGTLLGDHVPPEFYARKGFVMADAAAAIASAGIWWVARKGYSSPSRLHMVGLIYQVLICFQIAFTTMWEWSQAKGVIPPLTWVPTIIVLFPLAKDPADRPQSARELSRRLAEVELANAWTEDRARDWWTTNQPAPGC